MHDQDPLAAHAVRDALQLLLTPIVPACRNSLQHEALLRERLRVQALGQLLRREALVVGAEAQIRPVGRQLHVGRGGGRDDAVVGRVQPGVGEEGARSVGHGAVEGLGHEHVYSGAQVFEEGGGVLDAGSGGD